MERVLCSTIDKSYERADFTQWFKEEISYYSTQSHAKIYTNPVGELTTILSQFMHDTSLYEKSPANSSIKSCTGLKGKYQLNQYKYSQISKL